MKKEAKKTTQKYVTEKTFEKVMANNAEILATILKEIKAIHEDNKYFRSSISSLNIDGSSYERKIEDLRDRVERLETRIK